MELEDHSLLISTTAIGPKPRKGMSRLQQVSHSLEYIIRQQREQKLLTFLQLLPNDLNHKIGDSLHSS